MKAIVEHKKIICELLTLFFVVVVFNILLDLKIIVLFSILKMVGVGGVLEKKLCLCS